MVETSFLLEIYNTPWVSLLCNPTPGFLCNGDSTHQRINEPCSTPSLLLSGSLCLCILGVHEGSKSRCACLSVAGLFQWIQWSPFSFTLLWIMGACCFLWLTSILSCMIFTTHFYADGFTFIWFAGFWGEGENSSVWRSFSLSRFVELSSISDWKNCFTFFIVSFWNAHDVFIGLLDNTQGYWCYLYSLLFLSS